MQGFAGKGLKLLPALSASPPFHFLESFPPNNRTEEKNEFAKTFVATEVLCYCPV